jgi:hypothetical protein
VQRFVDRVANPSSLLHFHRRTKRKGDAKDDGKKEGKKGVSGGADTDGGPDGDVPAQLQELVGEHLGTGKEQVCGRHPNMPHADAASMRVFGLVALVAVADVAAGRA